MNRPGSPSAATSGVLIVKNWTGSLRLRSVTHCLRARVDKSALTSESPAPDALLLDFR